MNSFLMAFGLASIALCIGTFLRAKVGFLRNMLVPASVIAGLLGLVFVYADRQSSFYDLVHLYQLDQFQ